MIRFVQLFWAAPCHPGRACLPRVKWRRTSAVSRNTVTGAFDQLLAEGYLEGRVGSGTFVAKAVPEDLLRVKVRQGLPRAGRNSAAGEIRASARGEALAAIRLSLRTPATLSPFFQVYPLWTSFRARCGRAWPRGSYGRRLGSCSPIAIPPVTGRCGRQSRSICAWRGRCAALPTR